MKVVVFDASNVVTSNGLPTGTLQYFFPSGGLQIAKNSTFVSIVSISIPYSWPNVSSLLSNQTFSYTWYVINDIGVSELKTFTIIVPKGVYEVADLNTFLQFQMIQNGTYLQPDPNADTPATTNLYFINFLISPTAYRVQLNTYQVPVVAPAGYQFTAPKFIPTAPYNPIVSWQANRFDSISITTLSSNFSLLLGYGKDFVSDASPNFISSTNKNQYSATVKGTTISYLGNTTPDLQPYGSPAVALVQAENPASNPNNIIYNFPTSSANAGVGSYINVTPPNFVWVPLSGGNQTLLQLSLLGATRTGYVPLPFEDPSLSILLAIADITDITPSASK
jgi:hypothetical protein